MAAKLGGMMGAEKQGGPPGDPPASHLVVLVHGVAGLATDLGYLASLLAAHPQLVVLAPRCNEPLLRPFEGIVAGGDRIVAAIQEEMARQPALRKLSFVGHSLGGLYARYAAGVLYERYGCVLEPVNLITIATPHLGVRRPTAGRPLLSGGGFNGLFNLVAERLCSQLGLELSLEDDEVEPLLVQLCEGPFLRTLRRFAVCRLYANVYNDFLVPYCTSSIQPYNPYRRGDQPLAVSPLYPHITLASLYRVALAREGKAAPAVAPELFPHEVGRELLPLARGPTALTRALTPLSIDAHKLGAAMDQATACAAHAAGGRGVPRFGRAFSAPVGPSNDHASDQRLGARAHEKGSPAVPQLAAGLARTASSLLAPLLGAGGSSRASPFFAAAPWAQMAARSVDNGTGASGDGKGAGEAEGVGTPHDDSPPRTVRAETDGSGSDAAGSPCAPAVAAEMANPNGAALGSPLPAAGPASELHASPAAADTTGWDNSFGSQTAEKRSHMLHMLFCLNSVPWERIDCVFNSPTAHEQIVNKSAWTKQIGFDTGDVCRHIHDGFRL